MPNYATAQIELVANTGKLTAGMRTAKQETQAAAREMKASMTEAKASIALLGEEVGVHMPRHLRTFVAGLPGVAQAMSAAFNAVAVIALANVVIEAGKKVAEFIQKTDEAARKNAEAWRTVEQPLRLTNDQLQLANDKLANQIAKLEGKPRNGLKEAIDEAIVSADKLGSTLAEDARKITDVLRQQQIGFMGVLAGKAGDKDVTSHGEALQTRLDGIENWGQQELAAGGDKATIDAKRKYIAGLYNRALDADTRWAQQELAAAQAAQPTGGFSGHGGPDQTARIQALTHYLAGLGQMSRYNILSESNSEQQGTLAGLQAKAKPAKDDWLKELLEDDQRAQQSAERVTAAIAAAWTAAYKEDEREAKEKERREEEATRGYLAQQKEIAREKAAAERETERQAKEAAREADRLWKETFSGLNQQLTALMTGQKGNWSGMFQGYASQLAQKSLQGLERWGLSALGLNAGKPDGSRSNPMYVRNADGVGGGGVPGIPGTRGLIGGGGLLSMLNDSNWAGQLFGGKLFGPGSFFGGGMASGGDVTAGMVYDVGEMGTERFVAPANGRIVPNHKLGGGAYYDFTGANFSGSDPVQTEARFRAALAQVHGSAVANAAVLQQERRMRTPRSKW